MHIVRVSSGFQYIEITNLKYPSQTADLGLNIFRPSHHGLIVPKYFDFINTIPVNKV